MGALCADGLIGGGGALSRRFEVGNCQNDGQMILGWSSSMVRREDDAIQWLYMRVGEAVKVGARGAEEGGRCGATENRKADAGRPGERTSWADRTVAREGRRRYHGTL